MDVGSVGGGASVLDQASVSMAKKSQDVEKAEGEAAVKLIESSPAGQAETSPAPTPAPGQPGAVMNVYA